MCNACLFVFLKILFWGHLAGSVGEHGTLDHGVEFKPHVGHGNYLKEKKKILFLSNLYTQLGARIYNHEVKSRMFHRTSQAGALIYSIF